MLQCLIKSFGDHLLSNIISNRFFFSRFFIISGEYTTSIQVESIHICNELSFTKTQRGRRMLNYDGYQYVENRQSTKNTFWRCSRYVKHSCRATISTSKDSTNFTIRVTGDPHTHKPEMKTDNDVTYIDEIILKKEKIS